MTDPLFTAIEKQAAAPKASSKVTLLPVDMERWPQKIIEAAYSQNPWLEPYAMEVKFKVSDPERKSAVGLLMAYPASPAGPQVALDPSRPEGTEIPGAKVGDESLPRRAESLPAKLPFVARSGQLYPINLLIAPGNEGASPTPLTEDRFLEVIGAKFKDMEPSAEPDGSGRKGPPTQVYTNVLHKLSGYVHEEDRNRVLRHAFDLQATDLIKKVAALEAIPADAGVSLIPDLLYIRRTPEGAHIKSACTRHFAGIDETDVTMFDAERLIRGLGADPADIEKVGSSLVIAFDDQEESPVLLEDMDASGMPLPYEAQEKVAAARLVTQEGRRGGVAARCRFLDGSTGPLFVGEKVASLLTPEAIISPATADDIELQVARPKVDAVGVFVSGGVMTEPVKIASVTHAGDEYWMDVVPELSTVPNAVRVVAAEGVASVSVGEDGEVWINKKAHFLPIERWEVPRRAGEAKLAQNFAGASLRKVAGNYELKGAQGLDDAADIDRESMLFSLMVLGVEKQAASELLEKAGKHPSGIRFLAPNPPDRAEAALAKTAGPALELSKEIYDLRPDDDFLRAAVTLKRSFKTALVPFAKQAEGELAPEIFKTAQELVSTGSGGTKALDELLSLTFLSPENISLFLDSAPQIESTIRALSLMLYASYLGLDLDSSDLVVANGALDRVLDGLKRIRMRLQV